MSGDIVVNEVNSNGIASGEWVELFNKRNFPINISGWKITDKNNPDTIPDVTIPANGYAVIVTNNTTVSGIPGSAITITLLDGDIGEGNGLQENGDVVGLLNSSNVIIDQMSYGNNHSVFSSPPDEPIAGKTLARHPNGDDTNTAADWVNNSTPSVGVTNP